MSADEKALKDLLRDSYKGSLFHTCQTLLNYKDVTAHTHMPIVETLESATRRKLICVPRGTFKSSIGSVSYPIWLLINNPNLRILIDSELYANSITYLREIKGHLQSNHFVDIFGDWRTNTWNESEIIIAPRKVNKKEPSITVGGIGTTKVGQHYDVIIGDDYNSPANSTTPEQRKKVVDHYQYNQSILDPDGTYTIIGTRYAEDDLIGWIIRHEFNFKSLDEFQKLPKTLGVRQIEPKGLLGG